jgi:protein-L-isoaspartate(D-aspartate) O-methyltransferase
MWAPGEDADERRRDMVERDIASRGVRDPRVLEALRTVPRERFLPERLAEFAYDDTPLPIDEGQTISQPLIVAVMAEAAELEPDSRVLEIGAGSGYGAAVLSRAAAEVWTIERHELLAEQAARRLEELGYDNATVVIGDGTLGLPEQAPFDAVVVTAGGPSIPEALIEQLVDGGRLIIPVGPESRGQRLLRVRRRGDEFDEEDLGPVRFVPLIGQQGWRNPEGRALVVPRPRVVPSGPALLVREEAEPMTSIDEAELGGLLDRIGDHPVVLLGEASHGTAEFYEMRARITRELIERKGFTAVAVEADHPDASRIDAWVRHRPVTGPDFEPFSRFPTWMWRNREVRHFVDWLHGHNGRVSPERRVSFHGLDIYSLYSSRAAVIDYLSGIDPEAAALARHRYGCLTPWQHDPASYGRAVVSGRFVGCEDEVVEVLTDLLRRRLELGGAGEAYDDAAQNALVVANAERYYRIMYHGSRASWNLRDQHMFETLKTIRVRRGPGAKVVVWEHNSHIGDASATEMGARGEHNVGMLARREYGDDAFLVGFGTHDGVVAAATEWGGPMERKTIRPSHPDSYERLAHDTGVPAFLLHLRDPDRPELVDELDQPRLERAIGVIYRPETELQSHYFQASLPRQFDEYVWFDRTSAVHPLAAHEVAGVPDTYPFGL